MNKKLITLSTAAIKQLKKIKAKEDSKGILFSIKSGGCNGFEYKFKGINEFENKNNIVTNNDLKIEICEKSLFYLLGTHIDWKKDIMGEAFVFENPMANASCGCGTSFSV